MMAHDPTHAASAAAAEKVLRVVRRRDDVFCWLQRERLEYARVSAVHLQALMEDLGGKTPDSESPSPIGASEIPIDAGAGRGGAQEAMCEEQRLRELCSLFGELCSQHLGEPTAAEEEEEDESAAEDY